MVAFNVDGFIQTIKQTLASNAQTIALHEPYFAGNEWNYVKECLDTGWVSSVGKFVDRFEHDLAQFTGAKYAIATSNGTSAMHICYLMAGVKPGDEVLVPTLTFVATVNALSYCGAIPHFIDTDDQHLGINTATLDAYLSEICIREHHQTINKHTGRPIRALCVMHTLGHPVDLDAVEALCEKYQLVLLEDAAEALGSYYKGVHVGHRGTAGALSFNGNKIITTGGGGAILTNDASLAKYAKHITTTAKVPHAFKFEHDQVGYNYRLPNLNAALGCAQLEQLPAFLEAKRLLAHTYQQAFASIEGVRFLQAPAYGQSNHWLNAILLDEKFSASAAALMEALHAEKIMVRPLWNLQHTAVMYRSAPRMPLPIAESLAERLIKLPSSPQLVMQQPKHSHSSLSCTG